MRARHLAAIPEKQMPEGLRPAAVKAGVWILCAVLFLACLWIVLALSRVTGVWAWFEEAGEVPATLAVVSLLAVLLISVAFIHDRILRKAGVRPAEPASVTVRKALRGMAVSVAESVFFLVLFLAWFAVWSVLAILTGVRAAMYQNLPVTVAVMVIGGILTLVCAFYSYEWIVRKRARG
jgi:hypothetical protein